VTGPGSAEPAPFQRWTSLSELWAAAQRAARGKRHRATVARFLFDREAEVIALQHALRSQTWRPGKLAFRDIRDPKPRVISVAPFADRVVHQALCAYAGPLERSLVHDTYACREGRGTHAALRRATAWARGFSHFVHLDVRKLFPSIDHGILLKQLMRAVPCRLTLKVIEDILAAGEDRLSVRFHFPGDDLLAPGMRPQGLPIGSLTSQHFANSFLSPIDHLVKDRLQARGYLRYMDDMLVFGDDPSVVRRWAEAIEARALALRLRLHPWEVRPTRSGVNVLGFRILPTEVRIRRSSVARAERLLARAAATGDLRFGERLRAVFAHWSHADSYRLRTNLLERLNLLAGPAGQEPPLKSGPGVE
jgi:RNA-directed DNA polymerase